MERRWAVLALRAARLGALDFSKISRNDPRSLRIEELVMLDIERELCAKFYLAMANGADGSRRVNCLLDALGFEMPWLSGPKAEADRKQELADKYRMYIESKKQDKSVKN